MSEVDKCEKGHHFDRGKSYIPGPNSETKNISEEQRKSFECWSYVGSHLKKYCPFKDQPCAQCSFVGHRASLC